MAFVYDGDALVVLLADGLDDRVDVVEIFGLGSFCDKVVSDGVVIKIFDHLVLLASIGVFHGLTFILSEDLDSR